MVIVSHDREFLIASVLRLWKARRFRHLPGQLLRLSTKKAEAQTAQLSAYERQQKELNSKPLLIALCQCHPQHPG